MRISAEFTARQTPIDLLSVNFPLLAGGPTPALRGDVCPLASRDLGLQRHLHRQPEWADGLLSMTRRRASAQVESRVDPPSQTLREAFSDEACLAHALVLAFARLARARSMRGMLRSIQLVSASR